MDRNQNMLDEFLLKHLREISAERKELNERFEELNQKETNAHQKMADLLEQEDVGLELFSPRSSGVDNVKQQIVEIQNIIEEVQISIAHVSDLIAENQERKEKYEKLLSESQRLVNEKKQHPADAAGIYNKTETTAACVENVENTTLRSSQDVETAETTKLFIDRSDLLEILKRIDNCIRYANSNQSMCMNELVSLQYYLKALLTDRSFIDGNS